MEETREPDGKMEFVDTEIADGKWLDFVASLVQLRADIHIYSDGYITTIEYVQACYNDDKRFALVDCYAEADGMTEEEMYGYEDK